MKRSFNIRAASCLATVAVLFLSGCDNYPGYPHNETPARTGDNYKSGTGYYGGVTGLDESHLTPGGPSSTAPLNTSRSSDATPNTPTPGMAATGTYGGNNSAAGSTAGMTPNNGTAPTQDGGSH